MNSLTSRPTQATSGLLAARCEKKTSAELTGRPSLQRARASRWNVSSRPDSAEERRPRSTARVPPERPGSQRLHADAHLEKRYCIDCTLSRARSQGGLQVISFVARRLLTALPLLLGVLTIVFLLVQVAPGRPLLAEPGPGVSPESAARLREIYGAGRPFLQRYLGWLLVFLSFDLGVSFSYRQPAVDLLREAARNTLRLAGAALILQFALGTALGAAAAWTRRHWIA